MAFAFTTFDITFTMFYVTDGAQFTFVTFIANTFAFFTVTVIPTVIWACFVLATFTSPVCVT
jgi:hypothetical protein